MQSEFDRYAGTYDSALNRGLSVSGESKEYFAHQRVRWLAARLPRHATHSVRSRREAAVAAARPPVAQPRGIRRAPDGFPLLLSARAVRAAAAGEQARPLSRWRAVHGSLPEGQMISPPLPSL